MNLNRQSKGSVAVDSRFTPWLSQLSSLWDPITTWKILLWWSKIRSIYIRTTGQWFNFPNPPGSPRILRGNMRQCIPQAGMHPTKVYDRCILHNARFSSAGSAYLNAFALQGSNRLPQALSYTNRPIFVPTCSHEFPHFARNTLEICSFHLRGFKKRIPSQSGVFWGNNKNEKQQPGCSSMFFCAVCGPSEYVCGKLVERWGLGLNDIQKRTQSHTMMEPHCKEWHARKCWNAIWLFGPNA